MVPNHQPDNELYHCSDSSYMDLNGSQWTVDILDFHQFEKSRNITRPGKLTVCELEHGPVEIVSFPMKKIWFSIVTLVYQRVYTWMDCGC